MTDTMDVPREYGDGQTDCSDLLEEMIDAVLETQPAGFVAPIRFPEGVFSFGRPIRVVDRAAIRLVGQGKRATKLRFEIPEQDEACVDFEWGGDGYATRNGLEDMTIDAPVGVRLRKQARSVFRGLAIVGGAYGVHIDYGMLLTFDDCRFVGGGDDRAAVEVVNRTTTTNFNNCYMTGPGVGVAIDSCTAKLLQTTVESNGSWGLVLHHAGATVRDCHFEGNGAKVTPVAGDILATATWLPGKAPGTLHLEATVLLGIEHRAAAIKLGWINARIAGVRTSRCDYTLIGPSEDELRAPSGVIRSDYMRIELWPDGPPFPTKVSDPCKVVQIMGAGP